MRLDSIQFACPMSSPIQWRLPSKELFHSLRQGQVHLWRILLDQSSEQLEFFKSFLSTDEQATAAQLDALRAAGCERVFEERASGGRWDRPVLHKLLPLYQSTKQWQKVVEVITQVAEMEEDQEKLAGEYRWPQILPFPWPL